MQPRNFPLALAPPVLVALLFDGELAEPHAASTNAALATAATVIDLLTCYLLDKGTATLPQLPPALRTAPAGQGKMTSPLWDCPQASPVITSAKGASRSLGAADAKLRRLSPWLRDDTRLAFPYPLMGAANRHVKGDEMDIDWPALRAAATAVAVRAHAPYSGLHVGAAGCDQAGTVVTGCNVENASYGLTLCAECGLVSAQRAAAAGPLVAVSVVAGDGEPLVPCGRCRQLLLEAGGPDLLLDAETGPRRLGDLLPGAFTPADLARGGGQNA